jgi:hypothetical protein
VQALSDPDEATLESMNLDICMAGHVTTKEPKKKPPGNHSVLYRKALFMKRLDDIKVARNHGSEFERSRLDRELMLRHALVCHHYEEQ